MIVEINDAFDGEQLLHRFENGFGASQIRHSMSYGGPQGFWEVAVIKWNGDKWDITYDTPITDDVIGWLDGREVNLLLETISNL